jgi:hypothetical protein
LQPLFEFDSKVGWRGGIWRAGIKDGFFPDAFRPAFIGLDEHD